MYYRFFHEINEDGGSGEKIRIEENVSRNEEVKQLNLKVTKYSLLVLFIIFTAVSNSN